MSRLTTWFDDGEPIWPMIRLESPFIQKLIIIGMWIVAVVDYSVAAAMSSLIIPPNDKNKNADSMSTEAINPGNSTITQHFFLRTSTAGQLTKAGTPIPPEHNGHPVGVIAMTFGPNGNVRFAGSMVSRKDVFVKKTGVAKAHGRLRNEETSVELPAEAFKKADTTFLAAQLGLYTHRGNHFQSVDWSRANKTKASAVESLEARLGLKPA